MRFRSLRLPAQTLRNFQKKMLAGKRRLRYQAYACGYFFRMPRSRTKILVNQRTHYLPK